MNQSLPKEVGSGILDEVDMLLNSYNHSEGSQLTVKLIPIIKKTFAQLFFLDYHFTFEELVTVIENFDGHCKQMEVATQKLEESKAQLIAEAKTKKNKELVPKIKGLNENIEVAAHRQRSCSQLTELLKHNETKRILIAMCRYLSNLQFAEHHELSKAEFTDLLFDFLWILNKLSYGFQGDSKNSGKSAEAKLPSDDIMELFDFTKKSLEAGQIAEATGLYKALYSKYISLPTNERASLYKEMFILWFDVHFYEHRNVAQQ